MAKATAHSPEFRAHCSDTPLIVPEPAEPHTPEQDSEPEAENYKPEFSAQRQEESVLLAAEPEAEEADCTRKYSEERKRCRLAHSAALGAMAERELAAPVFESE